MDFCLDCLVKGKGSRCNVSARECVLKMSLGGFVKPMDVLKYVVLKAIKAELPAPYHDTEEWQYDIASWPGLILIHYVEVWQKGDKERKGKSMKIDAADHKHHRHQTLINACWELIVADRADKAETKAAAPSTADGEDEFPSIAVKKGKKAGK
jgi:hypothetical protein